MRDATDAEPSRLCTEKPIEIDVHRKFVLCVERQRIESDRQDGYSNSEY